MFKVGDKIKATRTGKVGTIIAEDCRQYRIEWES